MDEKKIIEILQKIYSLIPEFECKHCHKCCKNIIWFRPEEIHIKEYMKKNNIKIDNILVDKNQKKDIKCQFLQNDRCSIYPVRPLVCRLQGVTYDLKCRYNKKLLSEKQLQFIKKEFNKLLDETDGKNTFYSNHRFSEFKKLL